MVLRLDDATLATLIRALREVPVAKRKQVTALVLRAASQPAAISGTSGWAASLAGIAIYDLVQPQPHYRQRPTSSIAV